MKRSDKNNFVQNLKEDLNNSSSVIVAHYSGLSVKETDDLRKTMRDNGAKFKVTKHRLTRLALADTPYESIADLFSGPTAIAYSSDPVLPAKIAVSFEKKLENFKIVGGSYDGEKIDKSKHLLLHFWIERHCTLQKYISFLFLWPLLFYHLVCF